MKYVITGVLSCATALWASGADTGPQHIPADQFSLPDELEATIWATTPLLFNPSNMDTDAAGRIYVAEGVNYRHHEKRRPEGDRIVVLEDTDKDGVADKSHTFVQEKALVAPLGVSVFDNKIVVAQPPSIIVYTDVNRNQIFEPDIDKREEILTGFNGKNHDHSLHAVTSGPDGKWYFNQGNCGALITDKDGKTFRLGGLYYNSGAGNPVWFNNPKEFSGKPSDDGNVWVAGAIGRMQPDGSQVQMIGHGFRNSFEHCLSSFGDIFQSDNDDPPACRNTWLMEGGFLGYFSKDGQRTWKADKRPGQSIPTAHWHQDDPGSLPAGDIYGSGSPTGVTMYENGALPEKYQGSYLSCEARQRVIFSYQPKIGAGAAVDLGLRTDLLRCLKSDLFRPSDVMVGADGALYVADWFDPGVGGHKDNDDSTSGTIYRIAPKGFKSQIAPPTGDKLTDAINYLRSPAPHVRHSGFTQITTIGESALPAVEKLLADKNRWISARAVWLLPFLGDKGMALCRERLSHADAEQRLLAFRALRNAGVDVLSLATTLVTDSSPAVRREIAVALRPVDKTKKHDVVIKLLQAATDPEDRTYIEACGLAAEKMEATAWSALAKDQTNPLTWTPIFARITWRLLAPDAVPGLIQRVNSSTLSEGERRLAFDTLAFFGNKDAVMTIVDIAAQKVPGLSVQANWWLLNRGMDSWASFGVKNILKERGIYDPDKIVLQSIMAPPTPTKSSLPKPASITKLTGDASRGKAQAARCMLCHQLENAGADFGPDLSGWVNDQGLEAFYEAVINPSSAIAHGYELTRVMLKDGGQIDGIQRSAGDPMMIESMGGVVQLVPKNRIKSAKTQKNMSLMMSADQLGLTAQDLADIAAYLKTL